MIRYVDSRDYFVMACEFIYMIFVAYYIVEEVDYRNDDDDDDHMIFVAYYIVEEV